MQIFNTHKIQHRKALIMADGCEDGKGQHCYSDLTTTSRFRARDNQEMYFPCSLSLIF